MKSIKKKTCVWKKILLCFVIFIGLASISAISFFLIVTADARLNISKLSGNGNSKFKILDVNGNVVETSKTSVNVPADQISDNIKNAVVAIEDKRFYKHKGIDIKRIVGAIIHNLTNLDETTQGASTITQQLVKNTHLSSEKTLNRKLDEIKIAIMLENKMSKSDILTAYLNAVYFGNGCTGIQTASEYYFDKTPRELTIAESSMLAGLLKAPSNLNPKHNLEKSIKRQNVVLKAMLEQKLISKSEYLLAKTEKLNYHFGKNDNSVNDNYIKLAKEEACTILNISNDLLEKNLYTIKTYLDPNIQKEIEDVVQTSIKTKNNKDGRNVSIVLNSENVGISAFASNGSYSDFYTKKQPASTIKPLIVYAPAIELGLATTSSFVLDEKTVFGDFSPDNAGSKYDGWISVESALIKSKNIPAVKLFEAVGVDKGISFGKKLGIEFDALDNNLSLALGGFTNGCSISEIAAAYCTFSNTGKFSSPTFISEIIDKNGEVVYKHIPIFSSVFGEDTSFLITDMLEKTTKTGTARKLNSLNFPVASKTGTVGNDSGNTIAWNVAYTPENVVCNLIYVVGNDTFSNTINGATFPTIFSEKMLNSIYLNHKPKSFEKPNSVIELELDIRALNNKQVKLASKDTEDVYTKNALFSLNNIPNEVYSAPENTNAYTQIMIDRINNHDIKKLVWLA